MPLNPNPLDPAPERILAFGPAGSGKTTNILNICKFAQRTHSPSKFYVGDSDFSMDRMMSGYRKIPFAIIGDPSFPPTPETRLFIFPLFEWKDFIAFQREVALKARPGDWVGIDTISAAWEAVRDHFVNEVFHKSVADYFLSVRKLLDKDSGNLGALDGWLDYGVINPMYFDWFNKIMFRGRYNLYATATSENLSSERKPLEEPEMRQMFLQYGIKPNGQKLLPFKFHTVLITGRRGKEARTITAVKDRERPEVSGLEVKNFTTDYLVNTAGWRLA